MEACHEKSDAFNGNGNSDSTLERQDVTLETLPTEILLHVCQYLDARFVIRVLSQVCKTFHSIFNDSVYWKIRIGKRCHKKYPAIPVNDHEFDWKLACIEREEQVHLWNEPNDTMDYYNFHEGIFAPVDSVHLMKDATLLAAGSRDRYLNILDLEKLDPNDTSSTKTANVISKLNAHKGWIWSITSLDNILATSSWDTYVTLWDLATECQEIRRIKTNSAVLCTHFEQDYFVAGGFDMKIYHMDPRSGTIRDVKRYHKRPVLCLAVDDNYILSASEDHTIKIYDRRAGEVYKTLEFENYPMSMHYKQDELWVGDKAGSLHLVDATDGDFNIVESYPDVHKGQITSVIHTLGAIYTCSTDKTINILEPTIHPGIINTLNNQTSDVTDISYQNKTLACASCSSSVGVWRPKQWDYKQNGQSE